MTPDQVVSLAEEKPSGFEKLFLDYVRMRQGQGIGNSLNNVSRYAVARLLIMNHVRFNWEFSAKIISSEEIRKKRSGSDRVPTLDEIKRILTKASLKQKCMILIMLSSGIRVGVFDYLSWGDLEEVRVKGIEQPFAKIVVYRNEPEQYTTFISPEAWAALQEYKTFREQSFTRFLNHKRFDLPGEKITSESPVIVIQRNFSLKYNKEKSNSLRCSIGALWRSVRTSDESNKKAGNRKTPLRHHGMSWIPQTLRNSLGEGSKISPCRVDDGAFSGSDKSLCESVAIPCP